MPMVQSTTPMLVGNSVYDEEYRLGRGILYDFRPSSYKSLSVIATFPGVAVANPSLVVSIPGFAVSTPRIVPGSVTYGTSSIKDYLLNLFL